MFDQPQRGSHKAAAKAPNNNRTAVAHSLNALGTLGRAGNRAVGAYLQRQSHPTPQHHHGPLDQSQRELAADEAAVARILAIGSRDEQTVGLVAHGHSAGVSGRAILHTMTMTAGTPKQKVLTGIAFCVLRGAGSQVAAFVSGQRISVDIANPVAFPDRVAAVYVSRPSERNGVRLNADTMYLRADISAESVLDQSTIIHEAEHAIQDSEPETHFSGNEVEVRAYLRQGLFIWNQLESLPETERARATREIGSRGANEVLTAMLVYVDSAARRGMWRAILAASAGGVPPNFNVLVGLSEERKLAVLSDQIGDDYQNVVGQDTSQQVPLDGIRRARRNR